MLYHPDDKKWIVQQLARLPFNYRETAMLGYDRVYRETHDATPLEHQKDGAARREANTRLRLYIESVLSRTE